MRSYCERLLSRCSIGILYHYDLCGTCPTMHVMGCKYLLLKWSEYAIIWSEDDRCSFNQYGLVVRPMLWEFMGLWISCMIPRALKWRLWTSWTSESAFLEYTKPFQAMYASLTHCLHPDRIFAVCTLEKNLSNERKLQDCGRIAWWSGHSCNSRRCIDLIPAGPIMIFRLQLSGSKSAKWFIFYQWIDISEVPYAY